MIVETLQSVLEQKTNARIEIIVIDDGSTDDGFSVVDAFRAKHSNIKLARQENQGVCAARNHGTALSTGDFIQFLDSDDLLDRLKIENQVSALAAAPRADLCTCDSVFLSKENALTPGYRVSKSFCQDDFLAKVLRSNLWHVHSPLYRRRAIERIGPWNESLKCLEDWEYSCRAALADCQVVHVPQSLALVRQHEGERLSHAPLEIVSGHLYQVFGSVLDKLNTSNASEDCFDQVARHLFSAGRGFVECGRIDEATKCFEESRRAAKSISLRIQLGLFSLTSRLLGHNRFLRWSRTINAKLKSG